MPKQISFKEGFFFFFFFFFAEPITITWKPAPQMQTEDDGMRSWDGGMMGWRDDGMR